MLAPWRVIITLAYITDRQQHELNYLNGPEFLNREIIMWVVSCPCVYDAYKRTLQLCECECNECNFDPKLKVYIEK